MSSLVRNLGIKLAESLRISQHWAFSSKTAINAADAEQLSLVQDVLDTGEYKSSRNGIVRNKFGVMRTYPMDPRAFPLITTKKVPFRLIKEELLWFLRGSTNANELTEKGVHIWDANGSREFLDSRGLTGYRVGELGPVYGYQWRHFGADYPLGDGGNGNRERRGERSENLSDHRGKGVDQIAEILDAFANDRGSRRIILNAWNPCALNKMALPPCHMMAQWSVSNEGIVDCLLQQRSGDVGLGVPFNIASQALLTNILIRPFGDLKPGILRHVIGEAHIYEEHVEGLREQLTRTPLFPPMLDMPKFGVEDILRNNIPAGQIVIRDYNHAGELKLPFVV